MLLHHLSVRHRADNIVQVLHARQHGLQSSVSARALNNIPAACPRVVLILLDVLHSRPYSAPRR